MEDIRQHEPLPPASLEASEISQHRTLTRQEFLASFQFSQGNEIVQQNIFVYLKLLHPEMTMTDEDVHNLRDALYGPITAIYENKHRHYEAGIQGDDGRHSAVEMALYNARSAFSEPLPEWKTRLALRTVAGVIMALDLKHLQRPSGRGYEPEATGHFNPYKDPWRSDLCYFGLQGHTTGYPDFDRMFADIADYWRDSMRPGGVLAELAEEVDDEGTPMNPGIRRKVNEIKTLISIFNAHHPDTLATL